MVVVLAVILILAGALFGVGEYLKTRATIDLADSELEVIITALQQYYDDWGDFPFVTNTADSDSDGYWLDEFIGDYTVVQGVIPQNTDFESSAALFYYLDRNPDSRAIVEALTDTLISNKDAAGQDIQIELPSGSGTVIDLPRFIDPWGMSIGYEYSSGAAFPVLRSAGPDTVFWTTDDIVN